MRFITIASGKGGVGRSTLTANLGIALAQMGKPTTVIDGCLTTPNLALLFKLEKVAYTINDVLEGEAPLRDVIYEGPGGVNIVPASVTLDRIRKAKPERLPEAVKHQPEGTKFVLIDAPGGLRQETVAALRAGKELLLVIVPETAAISNAMKTRIAAEFLGLKPIGVALNQVHKEEYEITKYEIEDIMNLKVLTEIPYDREVRRALKEGEPLLEWKPRSKVAKAIRGLAENLVKMRAKKK